MIPDKELTELLDRIERSNSLGVSSTYARLLRFLVDRTQAGTVPKEQAIAEYLLGKNFAKSDTSKIRVYIYHLRKKLDQYYKNEGQEETFILSIPKGGYKVKFDKKEQKQRFSRLRISHRYLLLMALIFLLCSLLANAILLSTKGTNHETAFYNSPFWTEFFQDDKPIQVIVGDLFIFSEIDSTSGEIRNLRIPDINSPSQFEAYKELEINKGRRFQQINYTHLTNGSSEWISSLTKIFHPQKDFNIRPSSHIDAKGLHDYNIVFVGMQKTASLFNTYFDKSEFGYDVSNTNQYRLHQGEEVLTFEPKGDPSGNHTDYGFIAKYPGPNDNTIFMFGGLWDSAASESLRNFTMVSKITKIEALMKAELGYIPQYFEMLIEVNGVDRIGFETKILHLREVDTSKRSL